MPRTRRRKARQPKQVDTIRHSEATRPNLPSAEHQSLMGEDEQSPIQVAYKRRNRDMDPQLVWRGKDEQDATGLLVQAPPLYIQERVHPKVLIDDLMRQSQAKRDAESEGVQEGFADLFADFNGLPTEDAKTEFYQHDANWSNRMIVGDSLQVMSSLAEREGLRGKVQCIYIDPPYGIRFNSNFQWSTTSRNVRDGNAAHITREPEQVKAFRDTWRDGIHSYLSYLRDRFVVAKDLLSESGSIFVQIGDENVHLVRSLMDEVFGDSNFVCVITFTKATAQTSRLLSNSSDYILWFARSRPIVKYRSALLLKIIGQAGATGYQNLESPDGATVRRLTAEERNTPDLIPLGHRVYTLDHLRGTRPPNPNDLKGYKFQGVVFNEQGRWCWKTDKRGLDQLAKAGRLVKAGNQLSYKRYFDDFLAYPMTTNWGDTSGAFGRRYVVETSAKVVQRCILMTTDPGDLVMDPTCGSGTTAYVAEQWGRRWITIDTSRVALALARARIMGSRHPYFLLTDSEEGREKEAEVTRSVPSVSPTYEDIRQGFVYDRVPHITLRDIANNAEIDVIWEVFQQKLEPLREELNEVTGNEWEEWDIPREVTGGWSNAAKAAHDEWWDLRMARQKEIDASIAAKAEFEYLYDKPYEDRSKVRVAGPFTVESVSPHRMMSVDENGEFFDGLEDEGNRSDTVNDFAQRMLEHLKTAGVQQAHKEDKIDFDSVVGFPGEFICAEGQYMEGDEIDGVRRRAGIYIGPEFGTVSRPDLVDAAREASEIGFDVLIACAFNYEGHTAELERLGRIPVLKARMNADLHMSTDLKNTGKGNLFVIFGEPDVEVRRNEEDHVVVEVKGIDVFHPQSGEVRSDDTDGIACWFVDTDYNGESFFVRQAYFLGAQDPYRALKTTLKAEIDADAWATLNSAVSRPFDLPSSGRIAVKIINHLGDEAMKVFRVE